MRKLTTAATSAPATGNYDSILSAFDGDLGSCASPIEHKITGQGTLGQPTTGYKWTYELIPNYTYVYNSSGWNEATNGNGGRTGVSGYLSRVYHAGQGDGIGYVASVFATGSRVGATSFLANPSATLYAGDAIAGADGVFANGAELNVDDQGHDAAGIGYIVNLKRSIATGALGAFWGGVRSQSKGAVPVDFHFSATGKARFGLDLSFCDFGTQQAAVTLKADQRVYGNAVASDTTGLARFPSSTGDDWFAFSSGLNGWNFIVDNGSKFQIVNNQVTVNTGLKVVGNVGFFGASPVAKPVVSGSLSSGAAVQSLLAALVSLGLVTNNTTP